MATKKDKASAEETTTTTATEEAPAPTETEAAVETDNDGPEGLNVEVKDVEGNIKRFEISIDKPVVDKVFEEEFETIREKQVIPGFRKGKAPKQLIASRYRDLAKKTVMQKLFEAHLTDIFKKSGEAPLGLPEMDSQFEINNEGNFVFAFAVECEPKFDPTGWEGVEADVEAVDLDEALDAELKSLKKQHAEFLPKEEQPIAEGDFFRIALTASLDGEPLSPTGAAEEIDGVLGETPILPGTAFDEMLIGKKMGEEYNVDIAIPGDFENEALQGKQLTGSVKVLDVKEVNLPEIDDDFVKETLNRNETAEQFLAAKKQEIKEAALKRRKDEVCEQVVSKALEAHPIEISDAIIEAELQTRDDYRRLDPSHLALLRLVTRRRMQKDILIKNLVRSLDLKVDPDAIDAEVVKRADAAHLDFEEYYEQLEMTGQLDEVEDDLLREMVYDMMYDKAVITELSKEEMAAKREKMAEETRKQAEAETPQVTEEEPAAE